LLTAKNFSFLNTHKNIFFAIFGVIIFLISKNNGMFWDNVLFASKMGNQLYYNSIFNWTIPDVFDPGHPPFLGFLLAIFWKIFGHKLWVSHLLMLPFVIGFFYQIYNFIGHYIHKKQHLLLGFLIVLADPTLATSFVLVNPEIVILFFFFLSVNGILKQKIFLKFIGLFFLSIISYRSMLLFAGLFLFDILNNLYINKQKLNLFFKLKFLVFYFLASLPASTFIVWRLASKGWLQTHPDSPWAGLWQFASPQIFFKNCVVLAWRYLDFGRVFIFLFLIISIIIYGKKIFNSPKNKQLLLLSISAVIFIIMISLFATNTFGHRYFIVSYICFTLLSVLVVLEFYKSKKIISLLLFLGLLSGNLWIYPKETSQGWDATLAHIPYHSLRIDAINYLNDHRIKIENVATFFPNYTSLNTIDLSGDTRSFSKFNGKNKYVFYATVYNLSDEDLRKLNKNYSILKQFSNLNINITIYILNRP
jgi:hypothetical protein